MFRRKRYPNRTKAALYHSLKQQLSQRYSQFAPGSSVIPHQAAVINPGEFSPVNSERRLHRQAVNITIQGPEEAQDAKNAVVYLTAGEHEEVVSPYGQFTYGQSILREGTNVYKAPDGTDVAGVKVTTEFGIAGESSAEKFRKFIRSKGAIISATRMRYKQEGTPNKRLQFLQYNYFGTPQEDFINPIIEVNPEQFHDKDITITVGYVLNVDTIMGFEVLPGEILQLNLFVSEFQDLPAILQKHARLKGGNVLL